MRKGGIIPCMAVLLLSGCMSLPTIPETSKLAVYPEKTQTQQLLGVLPPPARPVAVAVYSFEDLTGQFKPSETGQNLSRAVSQGRGSTLVKATKATGRDARRDRGCQ